MKSSDKQENKSAKKNRISIVGPVYPYKGGIAHHTALLAAELARFHEVKIFSFSLQYPDFLFPGEQQKDLQNDSFEIPETEYRLNSVNPVSWIRTVFSIRRFNPDLVIIPWWNPFFGPAFCTIAVFIKKLSRAKVLFLTHNVLPHERFPFDRLITSLTLNKGDFHIVQSRENEIKLLDIVRNPVYRTVLHPTYEAFKGEETAQADAREKLSLPAKAKILLFFGFVRKYKGLMYLIEALPAISERLPEARLVIAGDFYDDREKYQRKIASLGLASTIIIHDRYIADKDVGLYFSASDLVVLPYESATQSGIVQIAFGFNKPVLVTSAGGLAEVVDHGRTGYVVPPGNPSALSAAVIDFFEENREPAFSSCIREGHERFSWRRMAETIESFLQQEPADV